MTVAYLLIVECDYPGCDAKSPPMVRYQHFPTKARAFRLAEANGWTTRKGGQTICPKDHDAEPTTEEEE